MITREKKKEQVRVVKDVDGDEVTIVDEKFLRVYRCPFCKLVFFTIFTYYDHFKELHSQRLVSNNNSENEDSARHDGFFQAMGPDSDDSFFKYKVNAVGQRGPSRKPTDTDNSAPSSAMTSFEVNLNVWPSQDGNSIALLNEDAEEKQNTDEMAVDDTNEANDVKVDPEIRVPKPHEILPRKYPEIITLANSESEPEGEESHPKFVRSSIAKELSIRAKATRPQLCKIESTDTSTKSSAVPSTMKRRKPKKRVELPKNFICKFCSKPFTRLRTLESHEKSMHGSEPQTAKSSRYRGRRGESKKRGKKHEDIKCKFTCRWCKDSFPNLKKLQDHALNDHIK